MFELSGEDEETLLEQIKDGNPVTHRAEQLMTIRCKDDISLLINCST